MYRKEELEKYNIYVGELSDNDIMNISIYLLEDLKAWWGLCLYDLGTERLYGNLSNIIKDLKELYKDNTDYCEEGK